MSPMNYAELTEAYLGRGDTIDALNATIGRVKAMLDDGWGQSAEVDDLIDDIHSAIAGKP